MVSSLSSMSSVGEEERNRLRNKILANFRCGYIQVLVTTDVFGRGMDIPHLNYILNYDFPSNLTTYVLNMEWKEKI